MTKLIYPMSHILKASHGWQPQEIQYTFWRATTGERESFPSLVSSAKTLIQLSSILGVRNTTQVFQQHSDIFWVATNLNEIIRHHWMKLRRFSYKPFCFIMKKAIFKMLPQLNVYCVYVSACYKSFLCLSFWHALSFSWLSVTDANSVRAQGYYRNTNFLHPCLTCSYFKRWLYEHIYCSWNCLKTQRHWTTKMYSLTQC